MTTQTKLTTVGGTRTPPGPGIRPALVVGAVVLALILIFGIYKLLHHRNRYEKLADRVTNAIVANDMKPVERSFNAIRRPQLENRTRVAELSDFVNREGAFKGAKEDTPAGSAAGFHHFVAHFDKGDLSEDLTIDSDGKIADFHVRPAVTQ